MTCTVSHEVWHERIKAARARREKYETLWSQYARLYANSYRAIQDKNEDRNVSLPNGDQVKVGMVYRNIEQTMALLEVPEIGVRATAEDFTYELGAEDSHREAVVETALVRSLNRSGLINGDEECDYIKRDGIIIGHGINYTYWRVVEEEVPLPPIPVLTEADDGTFVPLYDELAQQPVYERGTEKRITFEAVQDEHVSPIEFLFDAAARKIRKSSWHGWERAVKLEDLRKNPRYTIPDDIQPMVIQAKDIYGEEEPDESTEADSVKIITIWDKTNRELITFIEHNPPARVSSGKRTRRRGRELELVEIGMEKWPVQFAHPDDSPFSFFIPSPCNDHPFGISQIEHIKNQAVEVDKLRSRAANLTRQLKVVLLYQKGKIDHDQLTQALRSPEAVPVGVSLQDGDDWQKLFKEVQPAKLPREIYDQITQAEEDVRKTTGISETPFGGAETATESENQMAVGGARPKRKRRLYLSFLTETAKRHLDYLREFAPEGQTIVVPAPDGTPLTLPFGRAALQGQFNVSVLPGGEAMTASPVKQKTMIELNAQIKGQFGPVFDRIFLRQMLTMFDVRDQNALMRAAQMGMQMPGMMGVPGQQRPELNLNDISNGQAIRAAVNAPNEGRAAA